MAMHVEASMKLLPAFLLATPALGWGGGSSSNSRYDGYAKYSQSGKSQWLYSQKSLAYKYLGCVMAYTEDNEDYYCLEDSSEDGTSYWYMMANCRRANVGFDIYGSDSGYTSCGASDFKESFHSTTGLANWVAMIANYYDDDGMNFDDVYDLPLCEEDGNGGYVGLSCSGGNFVLAQFQDSMCLSNSTGYVTDTLDDVNKMLSNLGSSCTTCYDSNSGNDVDDSLAGYLMTYSESCSFLDNTLCSDPDGSKAAFYSHSSKKSASNPVTNVVQMDGIGNKVKYVFGSIFLVSSFIMFLGILMMNRRKRRANLNRKFRQAATGRKQRREGKVRSRSRRSGRESGSRSRSRGKSSDKRSRSRARVQEADEETPVEKAGVYT